MSIIKAGTSALLLALSTDFAFAETANNENCNDRDTIVRSLNDRYGETRQGRGLVDESTLMEVFANEENGTWTITILKSDGQMCLMSTGQSYRETEEVPIDPTDPDPSLNACSSRDIFVNQLATSYGEVVQGAGLAANNSIVEIFANETTGSWSLAMTQPNGQTCFLTGGSDYQKLEEPEIIPGIMA